MKYSLLVCDIDGTLTDGSGQIPKTTAEAIKKVVERGKYVVLASGRPFVGTRSLCRALGLEGMPTITQNGAVVVDKNGNIIRKYTLECSAELSRLGRMNGCSVALWRGDELFCFEYDRRIAEYKKISGVEPITRDLTTIDGATKVLWITNALDAERYEKQMQSGAYTCMRSQAEFVDFVSRDASKGNALECVAEYLGVSLDETVAIGDGMNDISMIKRAGLGVAVENALDEAKAASGMVCDRDIGEFVLNMMSENIL